MINYDNNLMIYEERILNSIYGETNLVVDEELKNQLNFILDTLYDREKKVLQMHYGDGLTLEEISKEFNVTRERIRQIETKALRKMRSPLRYNALFNSDECKQLLDRKKALEQLVIDKEHYMESLKQEIEKLECGLANYTELQEKAKNLGIDVDSYGKTIDDVVMSVRTYNCMKRAGLNYLRNIAELSRHDILQIRNLGRKSFLELKNILLENGYVINWMEE